MKVNKEKEAMLPVKLLKELLCYERETGLFYWRVSKARRITVGQVAGSLDKCSGYVEIRINGNIYKAHRLAWAYIHGNYPSGEQSFIDHINGKRDDNRIANLKASSRADNNKNSQIRSDNTSGVTGVHRYKRKRCLGKIDTYWRASWYDENGKQHLKSFSIHTHGEKEARQMALNYRAEQLRLLELNYGIKYSERHGI